MTPLRPPGARFSAWEHRSLGFRLLVGVVLGGLAMFVNQWRAEILLQGSPLFILGPLFVLGAFALGGPVAGIVAVLWGYASRVTWGWVPSIAFAIYALEGLFVWYLLPRTRSVVLNVLLFWLVAGGVLDYVLYHRLGGLAAGFVVVVFAKQVFNETLCAALLELVLRHPWVAQRVGLTREPAPLLRLARGRAVLMAMVPVVLMALALERLEFQSQRATQYAQHLASSDAINAVVEVVTRDRLEELRLLAHRIEATLARGDAKAAASRLASFSADHREYHGVFAADAIGTVIAASPATAARGLSRDTLHLGAAPLFESTRQRGRATFAPLLRTARGRSGAFVLPIAEPLQDADGQFNGLVAALLPVQELQSLVSGAHIDSLATVTLLDQRFQVLATNDTAFQSLGQNRAAELEPLFAQAKLAGYRLEYQPKTDSTRPARIGIAVRDALFRPVPATEWSVLVEHPADLIYARMLAPTLWIMAGVYAALGIIVMVVGIIGRRAGDPLRAVHQSASDVMEGRYGTTEALAGLAESEVLEVRVLAERLRGVEEAMRAQQAAAYAQQQELERQLVHAQKMEGLGRLAGGVAHDFNNLLTPIIGFAEIARAELPPDSPAVDDLSQIKHAAQRAQDVARHLLAFGRAQMLEMRPLYVDDVIRDFLPLLRGAIRENVQIELDPRATRRVRADASQLQQVIMNLGLNAADAMPSGGTLSIRTRDADLSAPDGGLRRCVEILVTDTGHGMEAAIAQRAFEPFFTTKPVGKGTGLGLAMVYGIVNQHGGTVEVRSVVGSGTEFHVVLPSTDAEGAPAVSSRRRTGESGAVGHETVLVLEDEPSVRALVRAALKRAGYTVIDDVTAESAMAYAEHPENEVDLLLTDVVMPGASGPAVAARLRVARPSLRVLFMSGYAADEVSTHLASLPNARFISKPFDVETLTRAVRDALDAPA